MFVNPSKAYPMVFIFSIGKEYKNRKDLYEATRKYWDGNISQYYSEQNMVAVGLINGIVNSVYKIDRWFKTSYTDNKLKGRYEFDGHEEQELTNEFMNKDFSIIIQQTQYWNRGNWLIVSFDGNGSFNFIRPGTLPETYSCLNASKITIVHKNTVSIAKDFVGNEIREKIREIGKLWNEHQNKRIFPEPAYSDWQKLIEFWRDCPDLPLIIRKNKEHRGESVIHPSGREIIFSDNSFATWVLCNVLENKTISVLEIKKLLEDDQIPFMMVANKNAKYRKTQEPNITDGWKLCHKEEVGFKTRKSVNELDIKLIERKFFLFANPKNMFLLPKDIGGIGEIKEFIEEQTN